MFHLASPWLSEQSLLVKYCPAKPGFEPMFERPYFVQSIKDGWVEDKMLSGLELGQSCIQRWKKLVKKEWMCVCVCVWVGVEYIYIYMCVGESVCLRVCVRERARERGFWRDWKGWLLVGRIFRDKASIKMRGVKLLLRSFSLSSVRWIAFAQATKSI